MSQGVHDPSNGPPMSPMERTRCFGGVLSLVMIVILHVAFEGLARRFFPIDRWKHLDLHHVAIPLREIRQIGQQREDGVRRLLERDRARVRLMRGNRVTPTR